MDNIIQARHNFALAFQHCWNGEEFPIFREISVSELGDIHTGYLAIGLLDEALDLKPDFQEARDLRGDIWHAILTNNCEDHYEKYLNSKAWSEAREKFFEQVGRQCICGNPATQVHHKTYDNIGKENLLTELVGLCVIAIAIRNSMKTILGGKRIGINSKLTWKKMGTNYSCFLNPIYLRFTAFRLIKKPSNLWTYIKRVPVWLIAYRSVKKLQANLCMQSSAHYSVLKGQKEIIEGQFDDNLGELRWADDRKWIGFSNNTVGNVKTANTDQEFSWLHDSLVRLHEVFQPRVLELQEGDTNAT